MVLIPIRSPLLSLCITIISVICELAFLTAALSFLRYSACRRLRKKQRVPVRAQHKRVLAVTLFAMLAFVTIETVTSIFSDPQTRRVIEIQPCVRNMVGVSSNEGPLQSEAIHFRCTNIQGTNVSHFEGNYSRKTNTSACAPDAAYAYTIGKNITLPRDNNTLVECQFQSCAYATISNNTLFISGPSTPRTQDIVYLPTNLNPPDVKRLNVTKVAASLAMSFINGVTEEGEIRRRALLGSREDNCAFVLDGGPATSIPLGVIIGAGVVWISSLLFFFASLFVRKKIFFDITHPMHWARRARHDLNRAAGADPELEMAEVDGELRITVTGYMPPVDDD